MDYLSDIQPLEADNTDAEIAALLSASTVSDIPIAELENFFDFEGLAKRNPLTGAWEGTLPDEVTNNVFGLGPGLAALFSHINKPRSLVVDTTVSPWASNALALVSGLLAAGLITQDQFDGFYALGGGRPNADAVEQDVIDARAAWQAEEAAIAAEEAARQAEAAAQQAKADWVAAYWGLHNSNVAPILDGESIDDVALVAALRSLADSIEGA